jgi:hypothetical protein
MTMRTMTSTVSFSRPFALSGVDDVQPAGTYTVALRLSPYLDIDAPAAALRQQ